MKILIANPGSTSYKCKLYDMADMKILFQSTVERIGDEQGIYSYQFSSDEKSTNKMNIPDYYAAVNLTLATLGEKYSVKDISAVGFKTVHARGVSGCCELNQDVLQAMQDYVPLAPVHTRVYLNAISVFQKLLPDTPLIGLFETAFHTQIPEEAFQYGIPYEFYQKYGIRKYGFHGASHRYIALRAEELYQAKTLISCHLGGSASVCAIRDGISVDTSMGMSPQSGLLNSNRVGDLDAYALLYLMEEENWSIQDARDVLMSNGGLLGISGVSGDLRDIEQSMLEGNARSKIAFKTFAYYVKRYIGEYLAVLNSADCIAFTAGAGQNSSLMRKEILNNMENLGIIIDHERNEANPEEGIISADNSKIIVAIIPTNEEYIVAREVEKLMQDK